MGELALMKKTLFICILSPAFIVLGGLTVSRVGVWLFRLTFFLFFKEDNLSKSKKGFFILEARNKLINLYPPILIKSSLLDIVLKYHFFLILPTFHFSIEVVAKLCQPKC